MRVSNISLLKSRLTLRPINAFFIERDITLSFLFSMNPCISDYKSCITPLTHSINSNSPLYHLRVMDTPEEVLPAGHMAVLASYIILTVDAFFPFPVGVCKNLSVNLVALIKLMTRSAELSLFKEVRFYKAIM